MGQLDNKVAIVTGATSGIGETIAEMFVAEGARVVGVGRRTEEGRALEERCGDALSFIRTDVSNENDVIAMVDHAVKRFGQLDCLVNNAGFGVPIASVTDLTGEQFDATFATNVRGVMFGMKHVAPIMMKQKSGSIITIASAAGLRAGISTHIYAASKAAVIQLSANVGAELGSYNIRCNSISPGAIVTGIFAKSMGVAEPSAADRVTGVVEEMFATVQEIPRAGQTRDIAATAVFLASDASSFITGQDIAVCGGFVPYGKMGWTEAVEGRQELARRIKAELGANT